MGRTVAGGRAPAGCPPTCPAPAAGSSAALSPGRCHSWTQLQTPGGQGWPGLCLAGAGGAARSSGRCQSRCGYRQGDIPGEEGYGSPLIDFSSPDRRNWEWNSFARELYCSSPRHMRHLLWFRPGPWPVLCAGPRGRMCSLPSFPPCVLGLPGPRGQIPEGPEWLRSTLISSGWDTEEKGFVFSVCPFPPPPWEWTSCQPNQTLSAGAVSLSPSFCIQ